MRYSTEYVSKISPELRETKRQYCKKYNELHKDKKNEYQKWIYYSKKVGDDLVNEYREKYGDDNAKIHLREYVRMNPKPSI